MIASVTGKVTGMIDVEKRFWSKVDRSGQCWRWTAKRMPSGYGQFRLSRPKREMVYAHRYSWELTMGAIPEGMRVLHNCPDGDNPSCVNPAHLWLGTQADNMKDMDAKGRRRSGCNAPRGEMMWMAKLDAPRVRGIRGLYVAGVTQVDLAAWYGVAQTAISRIVRRDSWAHVP